MPTLPREADLYPDDLLSRPDVCEANGFRWWLIYTLARREKQLMRRLRTLEVPFYGPVVEKRSRARSGRVRTSFIPLFSGYVFIYADEDQRSTAMTTNCVSRWCVVPDSPVLAHDLRQIHQLIESRIQITPENKLRAGQRVRVRSGPLEGLEGVIVRREKQSRFLLAINFIQQGASVLLDDFLVEKI